MDLLIHILYVKILGDFAGCCISCLTLYHETQIYSLPKLLTGFINAALTL